MNDWLPQWLSLSLSGSLVALALFVLKPFFRHFGKTWQYYIWLLVLLRLLLPISPDVNLVGGLFERTAAQFAETAAPAGKVQKPDQIVSVPKPGAAGADNAGRPKAPRARELEREHIWGGLWLSVSLILFVRRLLEYRQFVKAVKQESQAIVSGPPIAVLEGVCASMRQKRSVSLCTNPALKAPMLLGVWNPMILLPQEKLPDFELAYIFQHELTHYRRGDIFYKWLVEITVCLHWFNPLVYRIRKQINQSCELSCDEAVLSRLKPEERQAYGDTLLNAIAGNLGGGKHRVSLSLNGDGKLIKERLDAIMKYRHKSKAIVFLMVILTMLLTCGAAFAGSYRMAAGGNVNSGGTAGSIRLHNKEIAPGKKLPLPAKKKKAAVTYESVTICRPGKGEDGFSYIHDIRTNGSDKTIVGTEKGMLAFDRKGNPLILDWLSMDSSSKPSYYFLYDWDSSELLPGQTEDLEGGWTLNALGKDENADKAAYILYCDKKIIFSDGTVWENPDYASWLKSYRGKRVSVKKLKNYYPYVQTMKLPQ